jgi:hypothetical protein
VTGKADFSEDEWKSVLEGPTSAGLLVSMAERGGTIRESFSLAKAWAEARGSSGASALIDDIAQSKPSIDRERSSSPEELKDRFLGNIREATSLLETKASTEEVEDYRRFTLAIAERVAGAKEEEGQPVSAAERSAIDEVSAALGAGAG